MPVPPLVGQRVAEVQALHGLPQARGAFRFHDEVDVVRHEAVVVEPDPVRREDRQEEPSVELEIRRIVEHGRAVVAPREEVVAAPIE